MTATFILTITGSYDLGAEGFWPDDTIPDDADDTAAAAVVRTYIENNGISRFFQDWELTHELQIDVGVETAWP